MLHFTQKLKAGTCFDRPNVELFYRPFHSLYIMKKPNNLFRKILVSATVPLFFIILLWSVKFMELISGHELTNLGILPGEVSGLVGVITGPFIHSDYAHLVNNSIPLLVAGTLLFMFYEKVAFKVFSLVFVLTGIMVWIIGRDAYHIGASGVVYGLVAFVFFSGVLSGNRHMIAISLLMTFLYGSMIWGVIPWDIDNYRISWEAHLSGAFLGTILALYFRKQLPKAEVEMEEPKVPDYQMPDLIGDEWMTEAQRQERDAAQNNTSTWKVVYYYKPTNPEKPKPQTQDQPTDH